MKTTKDADTTLPSDLLATTDRLINSSEVMKLTTLSRSSLWRLESAGKFPQRRALGAGRRVWVLGEVVSWLKNLELAPLPKTPG